MRYIFVVIDFWVMIQSPCQLATQGRPQAQTLDAGRDDKGVGLSEGHRRWGASIIRIGENRCYSPASLRREALDALGNTRLR